MAAGTEFIGGRVTQYPDFRKMLDEKNIDAVVVATPDHWHAMQTMLAQRRTITSASYRAACRYVALFFSPRSYPQ